MQYPYINQVDIALLNFRIHAISMKQKKCSLCGGEMKRNGHTKAGTQRWRCKTCNASTTNNYGQNEDPFESFLSWLFGKSTQKEMGKPDRTFRQQIQRYWDYWALPPIHEDKETVIYVDGLYLTRKVVILIASCELGPIGWYLARSENSHAWGALLRRIYTPELVVTDGGTGFEKTRKRLWSQAKVQRCLYHVFCQIRRLTTSHPNLPAGQELYALAKDLLHISTYIEANVWIQHYLNWSKKWDTFLQEKTYDEYGRWVYTHERLHRARCGLNKLLAQNVLFTYLENPAYSSTNNRIEGGINAQLRAMLHHHRGMPLMHQIKAVFWWCYLHSPDHLPIPEILETLPTDKQITTIYQKMTTQNRMFEELPNWGDAIVWSELHHSTTFYTPWN